MSPVLYFKHEPTGYHIIVAGKSVGHITVRIPQSYAVDDHVYMNVVIDGQCWAGRAIRTSGMGYNYLKCAPFSDTQTGKEILLKHMLLFGE